jgi:hypothetical protein
VDVRNLLFGLTPCTQDELLRKLDVLQGQEEVHYEAQKAEIKALKELHSREYFLRQLRIHQRLHEAVCPSVFTLRRTSLPKLVVTWKSLTLQLYCEEPGSWHPVQGASYRFSESPEWLRRIGPHVRLLVKLLKHLGGVAVPTLGRFAEQYEDSMKRDLEFMTALVKELPDVNDLEQLSVPIGLGKDSFSGRVEGAGLRALWVFLRNLDRSEKWGGLQRTLTPEGDVLWLCREHARKYTK